MLENRQSIYWYKQTVTILQMIQLDNDIHFFMFYGYLYHYYDSLI